MFYHKYASSLVSLVKLAIQVSPALLCGMVLLNILASLIPAGLIYAGKIILDTLVLLLKQPGKSIHPLIFWISIECLLRFSQIWLARFTTIYNQRFSNRLQLVIQRDFLMACAKVPYHRFEDSHFYQDLNLMIGRVFYGATSYLMMLISLMRSFIQLASVFALLFQINIVFLLVIVALNLLSLFSQSRRSRQNFSQEREISSIQRLSSYVFQLLTTDSFLRDIKLFGTETFFRRLYFQQCEKIHQARQTMLAKDQNFHSLFETLSALSYYAFYIHIIFSVLKGVLSVGDISLYQRAYTAIDSGLLSFMNCLNNIDESHLYFKKYFDFQADTLTPKTGQDLNQPLQKIDIQHLSFCYAGAKQAALQDIQMTFKAGEIVAIVGSNGCGKTTLIKLLSGLYPSPEGAILINGMPLSQLNTESYQQRLGVLFQDFNRYDLSLRNNIVCGAADFEQDEARLAQTIQTAHLEGLLEKLALGLETPLAKSYEQGQQPSSGEWQKIALSRLIFRDADLIILDEALTHLDNHNRAYFMQVLREWVKKHKKILVLVSHQLHQIQVADRIYVIDQGHLAEQGSHHELLDRGGKYHALWLQES